MEKQEIRQKLQEKLDANYNAFVQEWRKLDAPTLIEKAEEIAATKLVYSELRDGGYNIDDLEYLLRFQNPLEVVRDQWLDEQRYAPDDEMDHALWTIADRGEAEQDYDLDEAFHPPEQQGVKLC